MKNAIKYTLSASAVALLAACNQLTDEQKIQIRSDFELCGQSGNGRLKCEENERKATSEALKINACNKKKIEIFDQCASAGDISKCVQIKTAINECN